MSASRRGPRQRWRSSLHRRYEHNREGFVFLSRFFASLTLATVVMPAAADLPKEVAFGIISTESTQSLKASWQPFLADMEKAVGIKVNAFFASDYAGIIEGMRFNKVQLAWHGNKSAMEAVDRANAEVFAR